MIYIFSAFAQTFGHKFDRTSVQDRKLMQNMVFLISEMGSHLGDYGFHFGKHGPFSANLATDMIDLDDPNKTINFSSDTMKAINKTIELCNSAEKHGIDKAKWIDIVSSAAFIEKYIVPSSSGLDDKTATFKAMRPDVSESIELAKAFKAVNF